MYRLHVEESGYAFDLYSAAQMPGKLAIPQDSWDRITSSNTGDPLGEYRRMLPADNTVYHDAARPSQVLLPVIPRSP